MALQRVIGGVVLGLGISWLLSSPHVEAASADVERLLRLLESRPPGMRPDKWREQRREAARELGRHRERRAVPLLLEIIEEERFDVVLEIAIDALGEIGDRRAIEPLRKLLDDPSVDAYVRDAAASALRKLEGEPAQPRPRPDGPPDDQGGGTGGGADPSTSPPPPTPVGVPRGEPVWDRFGELPPPRAMPSAAGLIAAAERLEIVAGSARLHWDGAAAQTESGLSLRTRYRRQLERVGMGYSILGAASLGFDSFDTSTDEASWQLGQEAKIDPEVRLYPFERDLPLLFGQLSGSLGYGLGAAELPVSPEKRFTLSGLVSVGGGPGYGRIYDVGPRLRLKRLLTVLRTSGLLTGPVTSVIRNRIMHSWYGYRNAIGSYPQLGITLRILNEAGILDGPAVGPATAYRLVRILDDPQLDDRPAGLILRLGYGYSRELLYEAADITRTFFYATGEFARQMGTTRALSGFLRFSFNTWGEPDAFDLIAGGRHQWFYYNDARDPLGAMSAGVKAGVARPIGRAYDDGGLAYQCLGDLAYTRYFDRGSRVTTSLEAGYRDRAGVFLLTVEASHGLAPGAYAAAP